MVAWIKLIEVKVLQWLASRDILKVVATRFVGNLVYVRCEEKRETKIFFFILHNLEGELLLSEMEKTTGEADFEGKMRSLF